MNDKNKESIKSDLVMMYEGALYELAVTPFVLGRDQISSDRNCDIHDRSIYNSSIVDENFYK